ncbi:protein of unknown function [Magnetospira sp. QH-2]|nr:protein of unknown function [Magnetospira sp. QH-2]
MIDIRQVLLCILLVVLPIEASHGGPTMELEIDCSAPAQSYDETLFPHQAAELFSQGVKLLKGWCGEKDPAKALAAFMAAREKYLYPNVSLYIGYMHEKGLGTEMNESKAADWYRIFAFEWAVQEDRVRQVYLDSLLIPLGRDAPPPLLDKAMEWVLEMEKAPPERQLALSRRFLSKERQPRDLRGSHILLHWAVGRDYAEALFELGNRFNDGQLPPEIKVNYSRYPDTAEFYWESAADMGFPPAQAKTASICESFSGRWNKIAAYRWYRKALDGGWLDAENKIRRVSKDFDEATWRSIRSLDEDGIDPMGCRTFK